MSCLSCCPLGCISRTQPPSFGNLVDRLHQLQHRYWLLALAVLLPLADSLSPTPVESFGQVQPIRTSSLSVHLLSSTACLLSLSRAEWPWQKQHSSLCTAQWSEERLLWVYEVQGSVHGYKTHCSVIQTTTSRQELLQSAYHYLTLIFMFNCNNYCNFANILIFTVLKIHHLSVDNLYVSYVVEWVPRSLMKQGENQAPRALLNQICLPIILQTNTIHFSINGAIAR